MLDWSQVGPTWPHASSSRFVEAAGLRWHVQTTGSGPLVLLLHGTGLGSYSWAPLIDRLADRFSFVAPDFPGHTFSSMPAPEGLTLDAMAGGVRALLHSLELSPRLVIGHSAGAALGAKLILEGLAARGLVGVNPAILLRPDPRALPFWPALEWTATRPVFVDLATRYCADRGRLAFAFNRAAPRLPDAMLDLHHRVLAQRDQHLAAFGMMARCRPSPSLPCSSPASATPGFRRRWSAPSPPSFPAPRR